MTLEKQIQQLLNIIVQLQKSVLQQQTMIDKIMKHSGSTAQTVSANAETALKNDQQLLERLKNTEAVVNGLLKRERFNTLDSIGSSNAKH